MMSWRNQFFFNTCRYSKLQPLSLFIFDFPRSFYNPKIKNPLPKWNLFFSWLSPLLLLSPQAMLPVSVLSMARSSISAPLTSNHFPALMTNSLALLISISMFCRLMLQIWPSVFPKVTAHTVKTVLGTPGSLLPTVLENVLLHQMNLSLELIVYYSFNIQNKRDF